MKSASPEKLGMKNPSSPKPAALNQYAWGAKGGYAIPQGIGANTTTAVTGLSLFPEKAALTEPALATCR
jgi:hypothetical protein